MNLIKFSRLVFFTVTCFNLILFTSSTHAAGDLPGELASAIKQTGFSSKGIGIYIHAVDESKPLVSFQGDTAFNPASVIKLVTTAISLDLLGPGYRWTNEIWYSGNLNNGKLNGDLYFRGNGDPYLTPERFWLLLNRLMIFGVQDISGNVYFDNSYFDPEPVDYDAFDGQPFRTYNVGPNAVLLGFQATEFHFSVADINGTQSVSIKPFPPSPTLKIINKVKLSKGACGNWKKRLSLSTEKKDGQQLVTFNGRFSGACGKQTLYRRVTGANDHYEHFFLPIWHQIGGTLEGGVKTAKLPDKAYRVIEESSISLAEAIRLINKFSNNVMTRQLLLSLGAESLGSPGTTSKGLKVINNWLSEKGMNDKGVKLDNGAGLSRDTRISAAVLGKLLHYVFQQSYMPEFIASLPVSGYDGTMAHRFDEGAMLGRAHIKTGLLDFVQTMAGYVTTATGRRYVVVMLHNDPKAHTRAAERLQNRVLSWVYKIN